MNGSNQSISRATVEQLQLAVSVMAEEYSTDAELTALTVLDGEDFE